MASASTSDTFHCTPEQFLAVVKDYASYPEFLQEVKACKVLESKGDKRLVEFSVSMVKSFKYSMWMTEKSNQVSWEFATGDIFKTSTGFWKVTPEGKKCRAEYSVEATFNLFVPGPIAKALVSVNLPNMMAAYHKRVAELYG